MYPLLPLKQIKVTQIHLFIQIMRKCGNLKTFIFYFSEDNFTEKTCLKRSV